MKTSPHWEKIGMRPHHGICVPLFSLKKPMGEFLDLLPLIDWCKEVGLDCLQLLPLNDTGDDPSPYNALSAFALDPKYISLNISFSTKEEKLAHLRTLFKEHSPSSEYVRFLKENRWLEPYALFMALRNGFHKAHCSTWPKNYEHPPQKEIDFHKFCQFLAFSQMKKVKVHAETQGIWLKGDLQFLLSSNSADVWSNPSFFNLDVMVGAPPDTFNPFGQNWGFPLFKWEPQNYVWVKERLEVFQQFFHLYRIDHVIGFFRTWVISCHTQEASFVPEDPNLWISQGKEILSLFIDSSPLLPLAEDLGTIPEGVHETLKELGICSTKVIPWQTHIPLKDYEPLSLTTLSTPDTQPFGLWWQNHPAIAAPFASSLHLPYDPILEPRERLTILKAAHNTPSYFHINLLQEYLALFPELSWEDLAQDRINVPGTLDPANWNYRFRLSLNEILSHQGLKEAFKKILEP